jgi:hypothetical protein
MNPDLNFWLLDPRPSALIRGFLSFVLFYACVAGLGGVVPTCLPQPGHQLNPGWSAVPHDGQVGTSWNWQAGQNRKPDWIGLPQRGHGDVSGCLTKK